MDCSTPPRQLRRYSSAPEAGEAPHGITGGQARSSPYSAVYRRRAGDAAFAGTPPRRSPPSARRQQHLVRSNADPRSSPSCTTPGGEASKEKLGDGDPQLGHLVPALQAGIGNAAATPAGGGRRVALQVQADCIVRLASRVAGRMRIEATNDGWSSCDSDFESDAQDAGWRARRKALQLEAMGLTTPELLSEFGFGEPRGNDDDFARHAQDSMDVEAAVLIPENGQAAAQVSRSSTVSMVAAFPGQVATSFSVGIQARSQTKNEGALVPPAVDLLTASVKRLRTS
eukprot:TRINITY_DN112154_c0_g1_i1.p1 TRINITY_DN112154_c0_g1~~TRINITY_DN112154_c0_g1_i1.p1  ORF type:complete len:285 (+),score=42.89 TRINITY_DN112154_c0_g1_i1:150-1004(+)